VPMTHRRTRGHKSPPSARTTRPRDTRNTRLRKMQALVAAATFPLGPKEHWGQCVVVEGGHCITAAHCLNYPEESVKRFFTLLVLGECMLNRVWDDQCKILAAPLAIEPLSDVAVLGSPDYAALYDEAAAYDDFCERVQPVKLLRDIPERRKEFAVWIRTHRGGWLEGAATYYNGGRFAYTTKTAIECGTSGGPIVNKRGELVGVVSHGGSKPFGGGLCRSTAPLIPMALPAWLLRIGQSR
jgi:hypothetical protein